MKNLIRLSAVVSILSIAFSNSSRSAELQVPGLGETPCEKLAILGSNADSTTTERGELESWGQGYLGGLMTAHALQFARSSDDVKGTGIAIDYDLSAAWGKIAAHCKENTADNLAQAVMAVAFDLGVFQDPDPSVPGVYLLIEINSGQLPAVLWTTRPNGERCKKEILEGALFLDAEGRSAAFLTERNACLNNDGSESAVKENSVIFPGSYVVSGNQITIDDDLGTDVAVLNGNILVYKTGGVSEPIAEFVFRRQ